METKPGVPPRLLRRDAGPAGGKELADLLRHRALVRGPTPTTANAAAPVIAYAAEPGSRSEEARKLLGSWAATVDPAESARATDHS